MCFKGRIFLGAFPMKPLKLNLQNLKGDVHTVIARFVGKVQELESGLETGVTGASPPTVTSMGSSFYLGGQVQGRRP